MKRSHKIWILAVIAVIILVLLKIASDNFRSRKISQITIDIDAKGGPALVTEEEVMELISQGDDSLTKREVGDVDLEWIENIVRTNPYVGKVDAFINMDASLTVHVEQSVPVVRVFNKKGETWLMDDQGRMLPINRGATPGLLIATGEISDRFAPSVKYPLPDSVGWREARSLPVMQKVYMVANAIHEDSVLNRLISMVYISDSTHIELIPVIGEQIIILGDVDGLSQKLLNLRYFYSVGYHDIDVGKYSAFDIRFENQVVCIKKEEI